MARELIHGETFPQIIGRIAYAGQALLIVQDKGVHVADMIRRAYPKAKPGFEFVIMNKLYSMPRGFAKIGKAIDRIQMANKRKAKVVSLLIPLTQYYFDKYHASIDGPVTELECRKCIAGAMPNGGRTVGYILQSKDANVAFVHIFNSTLQRIGTDQYNSLRIKTGVASVQGSPNHVHAFKAVESAVQASGQEKYIELVREMKRLKGLSDE